MDQVYAVLTPFCHVCLLQPDKIKVPVQAHIGSEDGFFPPDVRPPQLSWASRLDACSGLQSVPCKPVRWLVQLGVQAMQYIVSTSGLLLDLQEVKKFVEGIKAAGNATAELYEYQGEGHAFMNKDPDSIERMKSAPLPTLQGWPLAQPCAKRSSEHLGSPRACRAAHQGLGGGNLPMAMLVNAMQKALHSEGRNMQFGR